MGKTQTLFIIPPKYLQQVSKSAVVDHFVHTCFCLTARPILSMTKLSQALGLVISFSGLVFSFSWAFREIGSTTGNREERTSFLKGRFAFGNHS